MRGRLTAATGVSASFEEDIARGITALEAIIGKPVTCSAAAGWRADGRALFVRKSCSTCGITAIAVEPPYSVRY